MVDNLERDHSTMEAALIQVKPLRPPPSSAPGVAVAVAANPGTPSVAGNPPTTTSLVPGSSGGGSGGTDTGSPATDKELGASNPKPRTACSTRPPLFIPSVACVIAWLVVAFGVFVAIGGHTSPLCRELYTCEYCEPMSHLGGELRRTRVLPTPPHTALQFQCLVCGKA